MSAARLRLRGTAATVAAALVLALGRSSPVRRSPRSPARPPQRRRLPAVRAGLPRPARVLGTRRRRGHAAPGRACRRSPRATRRARRDVHLLRGGARGLQYLDRRADTGPFIEVINLAEPPRTRASARSLDEERGDGLTEGLPDRRREASTKRPLYLVKVTAPEDRRLVDGVAPIPEADREHFVWSLSIHGIERAGVEGGLRADRGPGHLGRQRARAACCWRPTTATRSHESAATRPQPARSARC